MEEVLPDPNTKFVWRVSAVHPAPPGAKLVGQGRFCWAMAGNGKSDKSWRQTQVSGTAAS